MFQENCSRHLVLIPRQWPALLALTAILAAIPFVLQNDYFLLLFNVIALNALVVLGLNLLIGSTGQVSLGHAAFYGMGAYLSAIAGTTWQWPLLYSLLFALVLVGLVSFMLALPTLRLEGHYLVMATLGFNIIISIVLNQWDDLTGGPSGFPGIPSLTFGPFTINTDREFYFFIWSLFLVAFALTMNLNDSRIGRALRAIHERELTAQALGIPTHKYKVITFVLSALYAAVAGFCYAHYVTFISPKTFDIFYSVQIVTMVVIGGMGSLWGGLAGAALLTSLPEMLHRFEDLHVLIYGLILMGVLVFSPAGLVPTVLSLLHFRKSSAEDAPQRRTLHRNQQASRLRPIGELGEARRGVSSDSLNSSHASGENQVPLLSVCNVSLSFGGLQALNQVGMDVFPSEIVALIGPNGAGKTTLLNIVSGLLKPDEGEVLLKEKSLVKMKPHEIAAHGVGRTFQAVQMYQHLTVLENALLGFHAGGRSGFPGACMHSRRERTEERTLRTKALQLLDAFGMASLAHGPIQQLTLVDQKLLELARALASSPTVLLLDEPVGGLNPRESEGFVDHISTLRNSGMGVILVEHDMNVVMRLADRVVVLQHGSLIASGTPKEIQQNARVIAAYLGVKRR